MQICRRKFLNYCVSCAATIGLSNSVLGKLSEALAADTQLPNVIWINAANCTGCTISLSNLFSETGPSNIADLLINSIDLRFHTTLMAYAGDSAVNELYDTMNGNYILAVEGGVPTAFDGHTCMLWTRDGHEVTALEAVRLLSVKASHVLAIGTCASYGGIPKSAPNVTGITAVSSAINRQTINIPGCPSHPDWIIWTIVQILTGQNIDLDAQNRPRQFFSRTIHDRCPREDQNEIRTFGLARGCLEELGCKGPQTRGDCATRKWNSGTNWCIGAGSLCIGCTENGFPDSFSPFYDLNYQYINYTKQENDLVIGVIDPDMKEEDPAGNNSSKDISHIINFLLNE